MIVPEENHKDIPKIMKEIVPELDKLKTSKKYGFKLRLQLMLERCALIQSSSFQVQLQFLIFI
jgi:hypothetical protein